MTHSQQLQANKKKGKQLGQSQRFERQPRAWAGFIDEVHFLHETTLSRLGKVAVSSSAQKPTQRVRVKKKENKKNRIVR